MTLNHVWPSISSFLKFPEPESSGVAVFVNPPREFWSETWLTTTNPNIRMGFRESYAWKQRALLQGNEQGSSRKVAVSDTGNLHNPGRTISKWWRHVSVMQVTTRSNEEQKHLLSHYILLLLEVGIFPWLADSAELSHPVLSVYLS